MFTLTIVRGLPGSGKSTLAKMITEQSRAKHVEADMYFVDSRGKYMFDPSLLNAAHRWCRYEVENALSIGQNVVVSNTFTRLWELESYVRMAGEYQAFLQIIECKGQFGNIHNVPQEVVDRMAHRWQNVDYELISRWYDGETEEVK